MAPTLEATWTGRPPAVPSTAIVLSGGADLGAFQAGVIDALARSGLRPDLLVGTSVGALNAAFWAFHPEADVGDRLLEVWLRASRAGIFSDPPWKIAARILTRHDHVLGRSALAGLVAGCAGDARVEDARIPLAVTATDLDSGERVVLRKGDLRRALLASTAIPLVFAPVAMDGRLLVDGSVVASCDVETAVAEGVREAIVVDLAAIDAPSDRRDLLAIVERMLAAAARRQTDLALAVAGDRIRVRLVRPSLGWPRRHFDLERTRELFALGRDAGDGLCRERSGELAPAA